jgi:predicted DNA binding protein
MLEATLKANPRGCWVTNFIKTNHEACIKILDCKVLKNLKGVHHFFEIVAPPRLMDNLVKSINQDTALYDIEIITSKKNRIHGSFKIRDHACGFSNMNGVYLKSAHSTWNNIMEWNLLGDSDSFPLLLKQLEDDGVEAKITKLSTFNGEGVLTGKQELILKLAFERGFYDHPKKIYLRELAKITNTTPSALTQILRKGLTKVLREYFISSSD